MLRECEACGVLTERDDITVVVAYDMDTSWLVCIDCVEESEEDDFGKTLSMEEARKKITAKVLHRKRHTHNPLKDSQPKIDRYIEKEIKKEKLRREEEKKEQLRIEEERLEAIILKPHEIMKELDKVAIGQEEAKRTISVALFNHKRRSKLKRNTNKSNLLLVGPTGCGKTHILKNACKISRIPYVIEDANAITEYGYVGKDATDMLRELIDKCKGDIEKAEKGVIFLDELDKIAKHPIAGNSKDISGEGSQQALLKIIEGAVVTINGRVGVPSMQMDTSKILFVLSGAFVGIEDIVSERIGNKKSIGFIANVEDEKTKKEKLSKRVTTDDIISFGIIPELVGRIPLLVTIKSLTKDQFVEILTTCKDSVIEEYQELFNLDNVKLSFDKKALYLIAEEAERRGTGARGLNSMIEKVMVDIVYHVQKCKRKPKEIIVEEKNIKKVLDF